MIVLDPELRYREDGVCYHPRLGYFTVSETWLDFLSCRDRQAQGPDQLRRCPTTMIIADKLIELGLARDAVQPTASGRQRPLPQFGDGTLAPLDAEIYPTYKCNHQCRFCSSGDRAADTNGGNILPDDAIEELSRRLNAVGLFNVGLVGGEPFLYPHLDHLIDALIASGIHVHVTTNGTVAPEQIAAVYRQGLHIAVSLHGGPQENDSITGRVGSYSRAVKTIRLLVARGIPVRIICVIEKPSAERVRKLAARWTELGVSEMTFCRIIRTGRAKRCRTTRWDAESIRQLETAVPKEVDGCRVHLRTGLRFRLSVPPDEQEAPFYLGPDRRCDAGVRGLYIDPRGDLYPCELLARKRYKLGNLLDDGWPTVLRDSPVLAQLRNSRCPESCRDCDYVPVCLGGCPALQETECPDMALPDMHCPFR